MLQIINVYYFLSNRDNFVLPKFLALRLDVICREIITVNYDCCICFVSFYSLSFPSLPFPFLPLLLLLLLFSLSLLPPSTHTFSF